MKPTMYCDNHGTMNVFASSMSNELETSNWVSTYTQHCTEFYGRFVWNQGGCEECELNVLSVCRARLARLTFLVHSTSLKQTFVKLSTCICQTFTICQLSSKNAEKLRVLDLANVLLFFDQHSRNVVQRSHSVLMRLTRF